MFHEPKPEDIEVDYSYINPNYKAITTTCRFRENEMTITIERKLNIAKFSLLYNISFESIKNCELVASFRFKMATEIMPSKDKKDDFISTEHFFSCVYLYVEGYLRNENNIPNGMIKTANSVISSYEIGVLRDDVFEKLTALGLYS